MLSKGNVAFIGKCDPTVVRFTGYTFELLIACRATFTSRFIGFLLGFVKVIYGMDVPFIISISIVWFLKS